MMKGGRRKEGGRKEDGKREGGRKESGWMNGWLVGKEGNEG